MDKQIDISIVIPVFNETSLIEELYSRLKVVCEGLGQNYEIIIDVEILWEQDMVIIENSREAKLSLNHLLILLK